MQSVKAVVRTVLLTSLALLGITSAYAQSSSPLGYISKVGVEVDVRSSGRILQSSPQVILPGIAPPVAGGATVQQVRTRGSNVQVNDAALDHIQTLAGFPPFMFFDQAETSLAAFNGNIVATYNTSAGILLSLDSSGGLFFEQALASGFSVSNDDGATWKTGFIPGTPGNPFTDGDPSVAVDRHGNFYFAQLADDGSHAFIQVNKSTDGGNTWGAGIIVDYDEDEFEEGIFDKDWLAVGPDPVKQSHDNVYVTWTKFHVAADCELHLGRSIDGGVTWAAKTIFVPSDDPDPTHPQGCLQSSNPVVDSITGKLYVPFVRFSNSNQDFIQMLVSDDGGESFHFATFNAPGAPEPTVLPITQAGELTSCGPTGGLRLTVHGSANPGPGLFGLPRYINATRILTQPALGARNGVLYLAWSNSTSQFYGDPGGKSNVLFMRSDDGGLTWTQPVIVNPISTDKHHVMPALAIDNGGNGVHITYYTQHANDTIDLDMANSHDSGTTFPSSRNVRVTSASMNLPPSNIPLTEAPDFQAVNYNGDSPCYALGEYQSVTTANGSVYAAWGDSRNLVTEPVNERDPISGQTHPQQDVFFQKVKAQ